MTSKGRIPTSYETIKLKSSQRTKYIYCRDRGYICRFIYRITLKIICKVLQDKLFENSIKIPFFAINTPHVPIANQLHIPAPAEAEGQVAARKALLVFPVFKAVGQAVIERTGLQGPYAK